MLALGLATGAVALASPAALASMTLTGSYVEFNFDNDGLWYDGDSTGDGVTTDLDSDGSWDDWIKWGSPWMNLTFAFEQGSTSYEVWGNSSYGYANWTTVSASDESDSDWMVARHAYSYGDLVITKTEVWGVEGILQAVRFLVENNGTSDVTNFRVNLSVDPDVDANTYGYYDTYNDVKDLDADGTDDWVEAVGYASGYTWAFGTCDASNQEFGITAWDMTADVTLTDPDGAAADDTIHWRHNESTITAGDSASFGFLAVFGESSSDAVLNYETEYELMCSDTDGDGIPDVAQDQDGDGVLDEDEDIDGDGDLDDDDSDGDGTPDYLDTDDDGDGVDTIDEDVDGDGYYTDDTDGDGTPDYLDTDDDDDDLDTADELVAGTDPLDPDSDDDGDEDGVDCAPLDDTISSSAPELCDGIDNDCDGAVDEDDAVDASTWYLDSDGDGFGDPDTTTQACSEPSGYVAVTGADDTDCDDGDSAVSPDATELCDGVDNDCDGAVDEDDAADASTWYADMDGDGYGRSSIWTTACEAPSGYLADSSDCNDSDSAVNPGATELCDGVDNDCDGTIDEDDAADASTWYADSDGDGFGDSATTDIACDEPSGYADNADDCDDLDGDVNPDAAELCNGVDDDCDGTIDEDDAADASTWYLDSDGDGFGDAAVSEVSCDAPSGHVADASDCDDDDSAQYPGADEYCNGEDDDCDGTVDEDEAVDASTWYADMDGDGFGDPSDSTVACDEPSGYLADASDCDDTDAGVNPDAEEVWYDGVDDDCDGNDDDQDEDGFALEDDCDDEDAEINPDAEEIWYDGVDGDCDGWSDYDADGDGFDSETYGGDDCDDADELTYPGAPDDPYDGVVTDCDEADEYDADGDGHDSVEYGGDDCDDANSDINPSVDEIWYDGVDDDCDGNDDDQDEDGFAVDDDCDDEDGAVNPDAEEIWYDGVDDDCDGNDDDQDEDGWAVEDDCDDTDPDAYPGAEGWDDECDPIVEDTGDTDAGPGDTAGYKFEGGGGCGSCSSAGGGVAAGLGLLPMLLGIAGLRRRRSSTDIQA
jgi:hypothetical protein